MLKLIKKERSETGIYCGCCDKTNKWGWLTDVNTHLGLGCAKKLIQTGLAEIDKNATISPLNMG